MNPPASASPERPPHGVWVPNWSSTLCDLGVFVYQPAEQIAASEMRLGMAMPQVTAGDELFGTHRVRGRSVTQIFVLDRIASRLK
jgi:hypothetical protein